MYLRTMNLDVLSVSYGTCLDYFWSGGKFSLLNRSSLPPSLPPGRGEGGGEEERRETEIRPSSSGRPANLKLSDKAVKLLAFFCPLSEQFHGVLKARSVGGVQLEEGSQPTDHVPQALVGVPGG